MNKLPEDIPDLPHDYLTYIGKGRLPMKLRATVIAERAALWSCPPDYSSWHENNVGDDPNTHYAVDVRSEYAKRCFPHLVDEHNQRATEENLKINKESTQEPSFQKEQKTELPPEYWTALSDAIQHGQKIYERWHNQDIKEQVDRMIACFEQASKE